MNIVNDCVKELNAIEMNYTGYSSHDDESHYECPKCHKDYGSWSFYNNSIKREEDSKGRRYFQCSCGQYLY